MLKSLAKHKVKLITVIVLGVVYYFSLPKQLFKNPTSTVIESAEGELLGAKIAADGQWRFPYNSNVPTKFEHCIIQFEDAYFYKHPGFNPVAIAKAFVANLKSDRVKRGGSTLTQQVIRLARSNPKRTYFEKIKELVLATRLEIRHTKEEILALYASNAPFGGNVVGLDVASWRYFGRLPSELSWAESATLAVLPNAPGLIYPGKNQQKLINKRNRLLYKLQKNNIIDELTYKLSIEEELPQKPYNLPQIAPHLLQNVAKTYLGERVKTSVQINLQQKINSIVKKHHKSLAENEINNIAVLVLDIKTRKILSYVGNAPTTSQHQKDVDIIPKPRSTGSILKPFLFAAMLDDGLILPKTLVPDVPTQIGSFNPENFNKKYDGAVFADDALARSLNVPAVKMLQNFSVEKFHFTLKKLKLKDIKYASNHYGLSLILGGAESNLWDLCKAYAVLPSIVNNYSITNGKYYSNENIEPSYLFNFSPNLGEKVLERPLFDAGSAYLTLQALTKVNRPEGMENWESFNTSSKISWKTGTSFGFRDAWAIGTNKDIVVGVWVGNADGEGRPGLVGISTAAPILFDIFSLFPQSNEFEKPFDELVEIPVCNKSGYRANNYCEQIDTLNVQRAGLKTTPCPFHHLVHLDQSERFQVNTSCEPIGKIVHKKWFVLPPLIEHYFKRKSPIYKQLPNFKQGCLSDNASPIEFVVPKDETVFYLTKDFQEQEQGIVFKVVNSNSDAIVYWYLNNEYVGTTKNVHEIELLPNSGKYKLTVTDNFGNTKSKNIQIKH